MQLDKIEDIIEDIRQGKLVILMDDEDRENEGDLIMAAEKVSAADINFMAREARGLICLTLTHARCQQLGLPLMVHDNLTPHGTNFTVSIEAAEGVTTGISAQDRALTVQAAVKADAKPADLVQPGHIFPVMSQLGGVLSRAGHTEAGCDLARMAALEPAAAIVEIMNDDGSMARRPDLEAFAKKHKLKIGTIADLIQYRAVNEKTVECINQRTVKTLYGEFELRTYLDGARNERHFTLTLGDVATDEPVLVRVHVSTATRDVMGLLRPGEALTPWTSQSALKQIADAGRGVLVLICHSETTEEIDESIAWLLSGKQRRPSQQLVYKQTGTGSQILRDLGVRKMRLMSAPYKFNAISGFNLEVVEYLESPGNAS